MILFISPSYALRPETNRLIMAANRRNIKVHKCFNSWKETDTSLDVYGVGAPYGEQAFCEFIAQEMRWNLYQNSLDWLSKLPHTFVKRSIRYLTMDKVKDVERLKGSILDKRFLTPADEQSFTPGIWSDRFPPVGDDTPVNVSTVDQWAVKFRFVIMNGKPVSECCYYAYGTYNTLSIWHTEVNFNGTTARDFLNSLLDQTNSAACIIDIGYLQNAQGWAVIGTQPIWTAELYGCDEDKFLEALVSPGAVRKT